MKSKIAIVIILCGLLTTGFFIFNKKEIQTNTHSSVYENQIYNYQLTIPEGWRVLEESQDKINVVLINDEFSTVEEINGPGQVGIAISHRNESYYEDLVEKETAEETVKKMITNSGHKGLLRVANSVSKGKGTILSFGFAGNQLIMDGDMKGQTANSLTLMIFGGTNPELLLDIANSFKLTKY